MDNKINCKNNIFNRFDARVKRLRTGQKSKVLEGDVEVSQHNCNYKDEHFKVEKESERV